MIPNMKSDVTSKNSVRTRRTLRTVQTTQNLATSQEPSYIIRPDHDPIYHLDTCDPEYGIRCDLKSFVRHSYDASAQCKRPLNLAVHETPI